jgi:hypothetical protein
VPAGRLGWGVDRVGGWWSSGGQRVVGAGAGSGGCDEKGDSSVAGESPGEGGDQCSVRPVHPGSRSAAVQYGELAPSERASSTIQPMRRERIRYVSLSATRRSCRARVGDEAAGHGRCRISGTHSLYLVTRSLDPTGKGRARWAMRWKPALNAFAITFDGRIVPSKRKLATMTGYTVVRTLPAGGHGARDRSRRWPVVAAVRLAYGRRDCSTVMSGGRC